MAETTRLISGGVNYYLNGGRTAYSGSGTPWTVQATTPFLLSLNSETGGIWTPGPAPSVPIYGGGPPFRIGRTLIAKSYDTVTETVGIQMYATSHDNAVVLLRMLRQILNTTLYDSPCILAVQPDGATNITYFEIYHADVAETPKYIEEKRTGAFLFRAPITWTRSIGGAGALTTLINAVTMQNRNTGSPDDVESLGGATAGDLAYEGQPLNVHIAPAASAAIDDTAYVAIINSQNSATVNSTKTTTTSSAFTTTNLAITNSRNRNLKFRLLARLDTFTAPSKIRLQAAVFGAGGAVSIGTSKLLSLPNSAATSTLIDFGYFDTSTLRSILSVSITVDIVITLSSSDGTSVTAHLDYIETLLYYTFAQISGVTIATGSTLVLETANDYNVNSVVVPNSAPRVYKATTATGAITAFPAYRGTLPRAYAGASFYLNWLSSTTNQVHDTADTAVVTVNTLPLYHTLRGGG